MRTNWTLCLLAWAVCSAQQVSPSAHKSTAEEIEVGQATFRIYCSPCHGIRGQGGRGPDLTLGTYSVGESDDDISRVIRDGVPGTEMPGFGESLTELNVRHIIAYIRSTSRPETAPLAGDPSAGKKIFWGKGQCAPCHRIGREGGRLGPNLTRVGRSRSVAYLRESILSPDVRLTPGYGLVTVVTPSGNKISGVEKNIDNFSVQLMDSEENIHSFLRSDLKSVEREHRSLMPQGYRKALSAGELSDLVSYLVSLGRSEEAVQ